jgi:hypothetical protein
VPDIKLEPKVESINELNDEEGLKSGKPNEPVTKEKLTYLRYFRLVTHRKRNGNKINGNKK